MSATKRSTVACSNTVKDRLSLSEVPQLVEDAEADLPEGARGEEGPIDVRVAVRGARPPVESEEIDAELRGPGDVLLRNRGRGGGVLAEEGRLGRAQLPPEVHPPLEARGKPEVVVRAPPGPRNRSAGWARSRFPSPDTRRAGGA